ncbi:MAG: hypothetical protein MZV64_63270 [Ignavibacteriales bacterium]|nr:hypothetical protein [Ignavibacteriales bacterium]
MSSRLPRRSPGDPDDVEDRYVHRQEHRRHHQAHHDDDDRLDQGDQCLDFTTNPLVVEVGHVAEHALEVGRALADADHVQGQRREGPGPGQGVGQALAVAGCGRGRPACAGRSRRWARPGWRCRWPGGARCRPRAGGRGSG